MSTTTHPHADPAATTDDDDLGPLPPAQPHEIDPSLPVPTAPAEPFDPPPETAAALLADLTDPSISLRGLAALYKTTLDALSAFLARPDVAARVDQIESAYARHARFIAAAHLPAAARYLTHLLDEQVQIVSHSPVRPDNHKALETRRRTLESTRRAASLLLRIARFTPGPTKARRPRHAADEAPTLSNASSIPTPTTSGRCEAHPRVSPSPQSPRLNDSTTPARTNTPSPPKSGPKPTSTGSASPPRHNGHNGKLQHAR